MVCSVQAIKSAGAAAAYYSQTDDYYRDKGHAPTEWQGRGAEALGLSGEVSTAQTEALLEGRLPDGQQVGGADHRPGWDATFSAPKSVSVAVYVHGDDRLISAHDQAVREAVQYLEREIAATRIRENGGVHTEATGNLVVASYRHDVSREGEPQIHTHNVIMNITQSADGQWRSLESKPLYRMQIEAGVIYRASLAREAERLGYTIEKTMEGKHPSFELREVTQAERDLFSTRSQQIEAELAKIGKTRETATPEEKQIAALNTRQGKENLDRGALLQEWRETSRAAGFEIDKAKPLEHDIAGSVYAQRADAAIDYSVAHLAERETRFNYQQIRSEALKFGMGEISEKDIQQAIAKAYRAGDLIPANTRQFDPITGQKQEGAGFTTVAGQRTEINMLALASAGAGSSAVTDQAGAALAIQNQEQSTGHQFNDAQRKATEAVLTGTNRITIIQGFAGTAKTTSVLAASAAELSKRGHEVVALAPTHSAANTLGDAINAESQTVAKFINSKQEQSDKPKVYVVDEASMLSARDMERLLEKTRDGKLILVGDVKQIGSVEAGAAFRQLQADAGLQTQVLDEIVRQKNGALLEAVRASIEGDTRNALRNVHAYEMNTREERVQALAKDYASMSQSDRDSTIIITPGRDDRMQVNEEIRAQLKERGELGREVEITVLEKKDMTAAEASRASSYSINDRVEAGRDYESLGLQKGESASVIAVNVDKNRITLQNDKGEQVEINPERYAKLQVLQERKMQIGEGDRLVNRQNTNTLKNGAALKVERVDHEKNQIHVRDDAGKLQKLDAAQHQRLDHNYATTTVAAQGRTCKNVLIHAESHRVNLQTQQNSYVALSRATDNARIYTDSREKLADQIGRETGQKETALTQPQEKDHDRPDRYAGIPGTDEPPVSLAELAAIRQFDPAQPAREGQTPSLDNLRRLSGIPMVGARDRTQVLLPNHESRQLEQQRQNPDQGLRRRGNGTSRTGETAGKTGAIAGRFERAERLAIVRDAQLAREALATKGRMPDHKHIKADIEKGQAKWARDSKGDRYLKYTDGRTYHTQLHGRVRETGLKQLATLGTTEKKAVLIDKHLVDFRAFGHRVQAIKIGEKVLISRETALEKHAGAQKDAMRERQHANGKGNVLQQANDAAKNAVLTRMEGWRAATLQESIRAHVSTALETRAMHAEAREKLEGMVRQAEPYTKPLEQVPERTAATPPPQHTQSNDHGRGGMEM